MLVATGAAGRRRRRARAVAESLAWLVKWSSPFPTTSCLCSSGSRCRIDGGRVLRRAVHRGATRAASSTSTWACSAGHGGSPSTPSARSATISTRPSHAPMCRISRPTRDRLSAEPAARSPSHRLVASRHPTVLHRRNPRRRDRPWRTRRDPRPRRGRSAAVSGQVPHGHLRPRARPEPLGAPGLRLRGVHDPRVPAVSPGHRPTRASLRHEAERDRLKVSREPG